MTKVRQYCSCRAAVRRRVTIALLLWQDALYTLTANQ